MKTFLVCFFMRKNGFWHQPVHIKFLTLTIPFHSSSNSNSKKSLPSFSAPPYYDDCCVFCSTYWFPALNPVSFPANFIYSNSIELDGTLLPLIASRFMAIIYSSTKSAATANMSNYQLRPRRGRTYDKYMQPDIMFEVFVRLPIEAVMTCKCVCKAWLGLIEDPYFVEQERRQSVPRALIQPTIFDTDSDVTTLSDNHMYLVDCEARKARPLSVARAIDMLGKELEIMSTCDGLLCIASDHKQAPVYVYNPVLNRSLKLPSTGLKRKLMCHEVGLIFHEASGTYKVVRGYRFKIKSQEYYRFEMITLGESAWTELTPPSLIYQCYFGRPLEWNGAIHWKIQSERGVMSRQCILSFDIDKEVFQIVYCKERPPYRTWLQMLVLDGDLLLIETQSNSLMKMWKVEGDIIGGYSINHFTPVQSYMQWGGYFRCRWVTETADDDTYMLHVTYCKSTEDCVSSNLVNFSPKTGCYSQLNLSGMPRHFNAVAYKPTLVCPVRARLNAPRSSTDSQQ